LTCEVSENCDVVVAQVDTVDGRNPAPVEVGSLSHYLPVEPHEAVAEVSKIENL